ncbi:MAG: hypothetical protein ACFFBH_07125 [Promethearchaeota archaeon]
MNAIQDILSNVLHEITPTEEELSLIKNLIDRLKKLLTETAKDKKIPYTTIEAQGSTGIKQTQLRGDYDIDLFIGLDYNYYKSKYIGLTKNRLKSESKKDFLKLCQEWILKSLTHEEFQNARLLYAEHPYVTVDYLTDNLKIKIDLVLYFNLDLDYIQKNGPITAVDRSPWHGKFIRENLSSKQKDEVRLLKQLFKACYSYGDKSVIGKMGFFGYSAELLIYYFNSLINVFNNFNALKNKPLDYFNRSQEELQKITHFQNDYFIIIDPIDKNRNVASAISIQAYKYCSYRIQQFLKHPNKESFKIFPIHEEDLSNKNDLLLSNIYIIELKNQNQNIHYTINRDKLYSLGKGIKANGEKEYTHEDRFGQIEFEVYFEEGINEYNVALHCEKSTISETFLRRGPPLCSKFHAKRFKQKNPNFIEKDNFLWTKTKREYTDFLSFIQDFVREKMPENLEVVNLSISFKAKSRSSKRAIYVLKNYVLPL